MTCNRVGSNTVMRDPMNCWSDICWFC